MSLKRSSLGALTVLLLCHCGAPDAGPSDDSGVHPPDSGQPGDSGVTTDGGPDSGVVNPCDRRHTEGDAFEPDECAALAREIGLTGSQNESHTLAPLNDEDWFVLTGAEGAIYRAQVGGVAN